MSEKSLKIEPPRRLMGRKVRQFWRKLAPQVAEANKLSITTEPLLARLCVLLARAQAHPSEFYDDDIATIDKLSRTLGLR